MPEKTLQEQFVELAKQVASIQKQIETPPSHYHNGFDSNKISWFDLDQRRLYVHHTIVGTDAATSTNYGVFFIVPAPCILTGAQEVHMTAGSDGSAVTLQIEKLTGTQALDGGAAMLSAGFNLKGTANTLQTGTVTATAANRTLAAGDRLAMDDAGTLTAVANVTVLIELQLI